MVAYRACGSPNAWINISGVPDENASTVGNTKIPGKRFAKRAGIEGDMLDGRAEAELVIASHKRDRVNKLEMIFGTGGIKKR